MFIEKIDSKNSLEKALKNLKRKMNKDGILRKIKNKKEFTKKSVIRRSEIQKAKYLELKKTTQD